MKDFTSHIDPKYLHSEITAKILQGFYIVCNEIGYGLGLDFFRQALIVELENTGLKCEKDKQLKVSYKGVEIGEFSVDILVDEKVNVKLISSEKILREHEVALINQLKLSKIEVGLLLNIYIEGEHKRKVFTNDIKKQHSQHTETIN